MLLHPYPNLTTRHHLRSKSNVNIHTAHVRATAQHEQQLSSESSIWNTLNTLYQLSEEDMGMLSCQSTALGRGLVTVQPVSLHRQTLISIPVSNALVVSDDPLTSISVFGDRAHYAWQEKHGKLPEELLDFIKGDQRWDVRLTAWLLWLKQEKEAGSCLWSAYLKCLPQEHEMSCLLNYNAQEAVELQIPQVIAEAAEQHQWIKFLHTRWFDSHTPSPSTCPAILRVAGSEKDTLWAAAMVRSRTFSEDVNGESVTLMVPYADLANHAIDYNATFYLSKDKKHFELRAVQPMSQGQEACISYGDKKSNVELMRDYGFIIPGNPCDRIPLPGQDILSANGITSDTTNTANLNLGPPLSGATLCEAVGLQGSWMENEVGPDPDQAHQLPDKAAWTRRCNAVLSLPLTDGYQGTGGAANPLKGRRAEPQPQGLGGLFGWSKPWTAAGAPPPRKIRPQEVRQERAAVAHYADHVASLMAALPTTVASDDALLQGQLTPRKEAAVRFRFEYKLNLQASLNALNAYVVYLTDTTVLPS